MGRILVVDDEAQIRDLLRRELERAGHEVEVAEDGEVALRLQRANPADVIILDMYMPEKEGVETLVELLTDDPHLKVIAISGGGARTDLTPLRVAGRLGAVRTLAKPVSGETLLSCVQELLVA